MANTFLETKELNLAFSNAKVELSSQVTILGGSAERSPVEVGRGIYDAVINVVSVDAPLTVTDSYLFYIEANTKEDDSSWTRLACLLMDGEFIDSAGKFQMTFKNPFNYQVRLGFIGVGGAIAMTMSAFLTPVL